jgi:CheY-like chemotaxis protein
MACNHDEKWLDADVAQLLESVTLELELRTIDVAAMIESVIAGIPARERDRIDHSYTQRVTVRGDEARLRFAFANLLNMTLACSLVSSRIAVRTTQQDQRAKLSVFAEARPREYQWVAVEVARKIVEAHDGSVVADMQDDSIQLAVELPASSRQNRRWRAPTSVLLVDDNVDQVTALAEILRHDGLTIEYATTGREALARIAKQVPDMLIVDVQLPDLSGADVIMHARQHKPELPSALLTGYPVDHPMIADAIAVTQSAYLAKPVNISALLDLVASAVR